jgi:hypothetical protein
VKLGLLAAVPYLWALPAFAQPQQPTCAESQRMCVLECRARIFASDPRQPDCVRTCSVVAVQCDRDASSRPAFRDSLTPPKEPGIQPRKAAAGRDRTSPDPGR